MVVTDLIMVWDTVHEQMAVFLNAVTGGTGANGFNNLTICVLLTKPGSKVKPD